MFCEEILFSFQTLQFLFSFTLQKEFSFAKKRAHSLRINTTTTVIFGSKLEVFLCCVENKLFFLKKIIIINKKHLFIFLNLKI
jgi:hypothetical protein